jgi:hypothetical protein
LSVSWSWSDHVTDAAIAAWPPLALLLVLEILTRIPISGRWSTIARVASTLGVAIAAGWLSYFHMAATASAHGEHGINAYVWPISVDGLMTVSAIALVEIGARIRHLQAAEKAAAIDPELVAAQADIVRLKDMILTYQRAADAAAQRANENAAKLAEAEQEAEAMRREHAKALRKVKRDANATVRKMEDELAAASCLVATLQEEEAAAKDTALIPVSPVSGVPAGKTQTRQPTPYI